MGCRTAGTNTNAMAAVADRDRQRSRGRTRALRPLMVPHYSTHKGIDVAVARRATYAQVSVADTAVEKGTDEI